tara:strand:- start:926 stop:1132 length:207 start_codon:yes stop_codon:yes gene_type:complete
MDNISEGLKTATDAGAGAITIGAILHWIPEATAILSLIWVVIRIYETKTFQKFRHKKSKTPKIKQRGK